MLTCPECSEPQLMVTLNATVWCYIKESPFARKSAMIGDQEDIEYLDTTNVCCSSCEAEWSSLGDLSKELWPQAQEPPPPPHRRPRLKARFSDPFLPANSISFSQVLYTPPEEGWD